MPEIASIKSRFTHIAKFNADDVTKGDYYESVRSGMSVLLADISGPRIDACICLGTRVTSDNGVAHTLEHLVFCGSKSYPYRGTLDSLANRCFAQGTNAWTEIDNTSFTISTTSQDGLINLLPVYFDHIFNPILCQTTFSTEVYNLNEDGEEGGVVFSEMQATEKLENCVTHFAMRNLLFKSESGYTFNSGGTLRCIKRLDLSTIEKFHTEFYKPENTLIVVVGSINKIKFLEALVNIEDTVLSQLILKNRVAQPWNSVTTEHPTYGIVKAEFMSADLTHGSVLLCLEGPARQNLLDYKALNVVSSYLICFQKSPLSKKCVFDSDLCSEITYSFILYDKAYLQLNFHLAKVDSMDKLVKNFKSTILDLLKNGMDGEFLKTVIQFEYSNEVFEFEMDPHPQIIKRGINFFLHGKSNIELINLMEHSNLYHEFDNWNEEDWKRILLEYFDINKLSIVKGIPKTYHLRRLSTRASIRENNKKSYLSKFLSELPREVLDSFPVPSMDDIDFYHIKTAFNYGTCGFAETLEGFQLNEVPLAMQIDDIQSNIVSVTLCMCLGNMPKEYYPYLPLVSLLPFEMPYIRKGVFMSHEEVNKELAILFFSKFSHVGWNSNTFSLGIIFYYYFLNIKTDLMHYEDAVSWIRDLLFNYCLDENLLKKLINSMFKSAKSSTKYGYDAAEGLSTFITFKKNTISHSSSIFYQVHHLRYLNATMKRNTDHVVQKLESIKEFFGTSSNIQANLACNLKKLLKSYRTPHSIWQLNFSEAAEYNSKSPLTSSYFNYRQREDVKFFHRAIPLETCDSSYLLLTKPSITSYTDSEFPALCVLLQFLSSFEGPLWTSLRGKGLAYCLSMYCEPGDGLLYFKIMRSVNIVAAYREALDTFNSYSTSSKLFAQEDLEVGISGVVFGVASQEGNICDAASQRMLAQLKGLDADFHRDFIRQVCRVTLQNMQEVSQKYLKPIVESTAYHLAISCPMKQFDKIKEGFKDLDIELERFHLQESLDESNFI